MDTTSPRAERAACFGPFRLFPVQRLLLEGETPVRLGSRALEILIVLVERPGELITKSELMARVWPNIVVEEGNLKVHVATIRRALGDGQPGRRFVATTSGLGYRFVAAVELSEPAEKQSFRPNAAVERVHNLPASQIRAVGRADAISALVKQLTEHRFVTIVGSGGIGKTTIALAVAEALVQSYDYGVRFVELTSLSNLALVPTALASLLGLSVKNENAIPELVEQLRDKRLLIVFDSCEHVAEAVATLAEQLLDGAPGVDILATSREPLRARGERLHHVLPLAVPPISLAVTANEALEFSSVQLFIERATANLDGFELTDTDAPAVAEICRKLEGIPLAIELAATRVDVFGVKQLSLLLNDRLRLLKFGRHTAVRRHQTLTAALDWSYEYLREYERDLLLHLSVFPGTFTIDAAKAVAVQTNLDVIEGLADLVSKSLVSVDVSGTVPIYRLLDTTRTYAMQKLVESGDLEYYLRRHADYYRDLFEQAKSVRPNKQWITEYGGRIDDVRSALNWAFSPGGDVSIGVALTGASVQLFRHLSLTHEYSRYIEKALASNRGLPSPSEYDEMELLVALGGATLPGLAGQLPKTEATILEAIRLAQKLNADKYQLRAKWQLWTYYTFTGNRREALRAARELCALSGKTGDTDIWAVSKTLIGVALYYLGDFADARSHISDGLAHQYDADHWLNTVDYIVDYRQLAQLALARILLVQGFPDQAMRRTLSAFDATKATDDVLAQCNVLGLSTCPIILQLGDLTTAERVISILLDHSSKHHLTLWNDLGQCFKEMLSMARGDVTGLVAFRSAISRLRDARFYFYEGIFMGRLAQGLATVGQLVEAGVVIDDALERCSSREEHWCLPELLRIKGEVLRLQRTTKAIEAAEDQFVQALEWARRQEALSWELRAATSLAELWHRKRKTEDAAQLLSSVYNRFTEGFETSDLKIARALIQEFEVTSTQS
jgi:predicted ATPase/DNA-binding winged helix-turn-helix (wHTH) protein